MPTDSPPPYTLTPPSTTELTAAKKSRSSPLLQAGPSQPPCALLRRMSVHVATESDADDEQAIYTVRSTLSLSGPRPNAGGLRSRIFGTGASSRAQDGPKLISTARGALCAGETETEIDEPPKHLPTSRIVLPSGPLVPPNTLQQRLTPLLFEFSRLLSIVPALFGALYNLYYVFRPPTSQSDGRSPPERVDFAISAIWAILTGYQCLCLTTGLLTRWRLYYPPLSTLIRLLALQGICWPATQLTCSILEHDKRPVIVWAVIGTTTCVSRSLQIWVTSNLWWETRDGVAAAADDGGDGGGGERVRDIVGVAASGCCAGDENLNGNGNVKGKKKRRGYWRRWGGKWGGRRWDWKAVGVKCVLPAGLVYFVMAWAEQLRREFSGR